MTPAPPGVTPDRSAADVGVLLEFPNPISETSSHLTLSSSGQSVSLRIFASVPGKTRVFRHCGGRVGRQCRQRCAKPGNIAPRTGSVSVGRYSSTAVLPEAVGEIGGIGRK